MKFEDLKLGGWYTHPEWKAPVRLWRLTANNGPNNPAVAVFDSGPGKNGEGYLSEIDPELTGVTEYDEYADAKALVEMRREVHKPPSSAFGWTDMSTLDHAAYKALAAKLREQGWKGAGK